MIFLVLVCSFVGLSLARPDVSHLNGYNYNRPSIGNSINIGAGSGIIPSGSYIPSQNFGNFGLGSSNVPSGSYLPGQQRLDVRNGVSGGFSGSNGFTNGGNGFVSGSAGFNHEVESVSDQKHVFFFAAPDDEEQPRLRINVGSNSQKNTKIIFIKAPNQAAPIPEVIAPPSQAEDKTLVYVLVKKPEHLAPITIPAGLGVKQAKPEVFFIKYKSKEEAEQAIAGGLGEQPVGSNVQSLSDEQSFLRTLKDDSHQAGGFGGEFEGSSILGATSLGSTNGGGNSISANTGASLGSTAGGASISSSFGSGGASISSSINGGSSSSKYGPPSLSGPY